MYSPSYFAVNNTSSNNKSLTWLPLSPSLSTFKFSMFDVLIWRRRGGNRTFWWFWFTSSFFVSHGVPISNLFYWPVPFPVHGRWYLSSPLPYSRLSFVCFSLSMMQILTYRSFPWPPLLYWHLWAWAVKPLNTIRFLLLLLLKLFCDLHHCFLGTNSTTSRHFLVV